MFSKYAEKILSYLIPFRIKNYKTKINGALEVNLINGKKTLDLPIGNFSYGALQKILHKGLTEIRFNKDIQTILVLGLGGGSIVETIREKFNSNAFIELVDIDSDMISIAINEFEINKFQNINIVNADASNYFKNCHNSFDLIIVDIFILNVVPKKFTEPTFIKDLIIHLNPKGKIIYNTFRETMTDESLNGIKDEFFNNGLKTDIIEKVESTNDLIIAEKI